MGEINNEGQFRWIPKELDEYLAMEFKLERKDFKRLKKKIPQLQKRDDKAFMDMLRTTSRNYYMMNQMVDRKSHNMISINTVVLSLIIGGLVSSLPFEQIHHYTLIIFSIFCTISITYAMIAMSPERTHGKLKHTDVQNKQGNPLFFGNFKNLSEEEYENAMMEMVNDRDFVYRSMIQDIYYLGQVLERKCYRLRMSQLLFTAGFILMLILSFIFSLSLK